MARPLRLKFPGAFYHIINRGNAGEDLKHLSRYIHLNPVRAKMVETASQYRWSSYPFFIGKLKKPSWLCVYWLLSQFGNITGAAITMRYKVAAEQIRKDKKLKSWINHLEDEILNN